MFTPATSTALLALAGSAFAVQSVPITRNVRSVASMHGITTKDRTRAKSFAEAATLPGVVPAVNEDVTYSVEVFVFELLRPCYSDLHCDLRNVGSQTFNLIVDTGSSNTWVGVSAFHILNRKSDTNIRRLVLPIIPDLALSMMGALSLLVMAVASCMV